MHFEYNGVVYSVNEKLGRHVLEASHLYSMAIKAIYGDDVTTDDERIDWNTIVVVVETAQRVRADGGLLPDMPDHPTTAHLLNLYGAIANAPASFVEALVAGIKGDSNPNATSTPSA